MRKQSPGELLWRSRPDPRRPQVSPPAGGGMARAWLSAAAARHRSSLYFALLAAGYIAYLLLGACIFSAIELPHEQRLRRQLVAARRDFLSNNSCVSDARLEALLLRALEASNYGVSVLRNDTTRNWDFVSSLFFSSTVLTTTGYGHTVPLSDGGKAFCVVFCVLGIPVTLFLLSVAVRRLVVLVTRRPVSYLHRRWAVPRARLAALHAAGLAALTALLFLLIPAGIFTRLEKDWSFLDSLYFCFISLSTVGLGDYVPGETHSSEDNPHPQLYRLAITAYLLLGLLCVLVLMETCSQLPQLRRLSQRFCPDTVRRLDSETANIVEQDHL
ncbi:unnamed protein product, partial [Tetraodon nigroviridis]